MGPHELFHNFNQHPRGINLQLPVIAAHNLIAKGAKGAKPILHLLTFERLQKMDHGIGDPESPGFRHLLYPPGMQIMKKPPLGVKLRHVPGKHFVDNLKQPMIPLVKKNAEF